MRFLWVAVAALMLASFTRPVDFYYRGCHFVYMGGNAYPMPIPIRALRGYALGMESGEAVEFSVSIDMVTGEMTDLSLRCRK